MGDDSCMNFMVTFGVVFLVVLNVLTLVRIVFYFVTFFMPYDIIM